MLLRKLELLAPAKNLECGIAAIDHGADAVYIGAQRFGARADAGNSNDDIAALCRYAHQFGAKVFVTVNTIIYDEELDDTLSLVKELQILGADAFLVQDMGLYAKLVSSDDFDSAHINLHASTQTDNRYVEKVKWLASLGFKRIVLARELSIDEIATIHAEVPDVELEVFVHGALCVSYSGQCYASHHCFKRSANRGECAQFCRLAYTLKDARGKIIEEDRHLLSLKDMCQLDNLEALVDAGAVSFKIEGRLKDVDYVKNVTAAYSQRLDAIVAKHPEKFRRASFGRCTYSFAPDVRKSFNRGFTDYFAHGRTTNLVSFDTPKAMGEYVGKVKELRGKSFNVAGTVSFANGDGLCFLDENRKLVGFRVNKVEGNRIFPFRMPNEIKPGVMLFRNFDQQFTTILNKPTSERKMSVDFSLYAEGTLITLNAIDEMGRKAVAKTECELQIATKPQYENILRQLSKLGGTIFKIGNVEVNTDAFIPSSVLASLRRDAIEMIVNMTADLDSLDNPAVVSYEKEVNSGELQNDKLPKYTEPYFYNASNRISKAFYEELGVNGATAFETEGARNKVLMQCRYCLKNEMGFCSKSGKKTPWKEPLSIEMSDGREFMLQFDCKKCQMNVLA